LKSEVCALKNVSLGDVLDIRDGTHDTPKYVEIGIPLITSKNLTDYGLCVRDISFISEADHNQISNRSAVENGDILYGMIGTIGKPTLVETDRKFSIKNVALFKQSNPQIHNKYLRRLLNSTHINSQIAQASKGGTQKFVSLGALRGLKATFPSFTEQRRIAAILDQADVLRTKRREALAQLDILTQSIFIEMFGDPMSQSSQWQSQPISSFVSGFESGKSVAAEDENDSASSFRVLKVSAVTSLEYKPQESKAAPVDYMPKQSYFVKNGDLLFSRANTTDLIGATAYVSHTQPNLLLSDKLWRFLWHETPRAEPLFVNYLFRQPRFRAEIGRRASGTSGSMKNISQNKVLSISVDFPPLELQRTFAKRVTIIDQLKTAHRTALTELDALFASLQHIPFRGEL